MDIVPALFLNVIPIFCEFDDIIRLDDRASQNPSKKSVLTIPKMGTTLQVCM